MSSLPHQHAVYPIGGHMVSLMYGGDLEWEIYDRDDRLGTLFELPADKCFPEPRYEAQEEGCDRLHSPEGTDDWVAAILYLIAQR